MDGLILSGGGDVDPARYGGSMHESVYMVDAERDTSEFDLTGRAVDSGKPVFGICRGIHVINVVLGGTLIEHVPDVAGEKIKHRLPPREPTPHKVLIEPDTRLMSILGKREIYPLSWHHQAIGNLAPGLTVSARAPDNIVEAIEMPGHTWLIGVQWHPELTAGVDADQQKLFDVFVSAVK
jgi:putative glutamine amidotransferase